MVLFLPKALLLFLYPVGLACLLMVVALAAQRRRPRLATAAIALSLTVLMLAGNSWVSLWMVRALERRYLAPIPLPAAEAIVVLGGGTLPASFPRPWVQLKEEGNRVVYAARLYREHKAPLVILNGGGRWLGYAPSEAEQMAEVLEFMGVPASAIVEEPRSRNTHENAVNVKPILAAHGIHRILLVTSAMHMPRALMCFRHEGIDALPAPVDFEAAELDFAQSHRNLKAVVLSFLPDAETVELSTRAMKEYLGLAAYRLAGWL